MSYGFQFWSSAAALSPYSKALCNSASILEPVTELGPDTSSATLRRTWHEAATLLRAATWLLLGPVQAAARSADAAAVTTNQGFVTTCDLRTPGTVPNPKVAETLDLHPQRTKRLLAVNRSVTGEGPKSPSSNGTRQGR